MKSNKIISSEYKEWLNEIKQKFQSSQIKASIQVNSTLLEFYWNLGNEIVEKQKNSTWGSGFLERLSKDLLEAFPDVKGFSVTNISYIRRWVLFYTQNIFSIPELCCPEKLIRHRPANIIYQQPQNVLEARRHCQPLDCRSPSARAVYILQHAWKQYDQVRPKQRSHPRRPAGHSDGPDRRPVAGRYLPERRLHPVQGAAAVVGKLPRGPA